MKIQTTFLLAVVATLSLSSTAVRGQSVTYSEAYTVFGDEDFDSLGESVSIVGDVNGDGFADFAAGALRDDVGGNNAGLVRVFSGITGAPLYSLRGDSNGENLGSSLSGIGDVNGDGRPDLLLAADGDSTLAFNGGSVFVHSGIDGSLLYSVHGAERDEFGFSVDRAGDVNNDGVEDFIVGADAINRQNYARVFSGVDGTILHTFSTGNFFDGEAAVSGAGDINGDGFADLLVGWPLEGANGTSQSGVVRVYSGADGSVLHTVEGGTIFLDHFGTTVSEAGDVNGDGVDDFMASLINIDTLFESVSVYSGVDATLIRRITSEGIDFGFSLDNLGDINNDDTPDVLIGAWSNSVNGFAAGTVVSFSGNSSDILFRAEGDAQGDHFGVSLSSAGDMNGDGAADIVIGARNNGPNNAGYARIFFSQIVDDPVTDSDGDGVDDESDNCTDIPNPIQTDSDGDGFGNLCDADLNNDCVVNVLDLGLLRLRFFSNDPDADFNSDGVVNFQDLGLMRLGFFVEPGPSAVSTLCPLSSRFTSGDRQAPYLEPASSHSLLP